ncbi:MAG TPA: glycosyltransferase family 92 protein [Roseovarius sp.]|nr:glycosyltransferase family 92 protein [Roseovarius sp.]
MTSRPKLLIGCFLRDERSDFIEWLACHRAIGASHVHIFTNEKIAGKTPLLDVLAAAGAITLHPVPTDPDILEEPRNTALRFAALEAGETGGYGLFLSQDEYFRINTRAQTVQSLMRACGGADVLSAPVHLFGPGDRIAHAPGPVLHTATQRAPIPSGAAAGCALRSVVRLGLFGARSPELPTGPVQGGSAPKWINGDGADMPAPFSRVTWNETPGAIGTAKAAILTLPAPSVETFLLRIASLPARKQSDTEALATKLDSLAALREPDPGLSARADAIMRETEALMALPGVAQAQADLCAREVARLDTLRAEPSDIGRLLAAARDEDAPARAKSTSPLDPKTDTPPQTAAFDNAADTDTPEAGTPEAAPPALPPWFAEIHTGGDREGFYTRLKHHAVACIRRDDARLVVTFDNLSNVNDLSPEREPWAYKFLRSNDCSHLSIMARRKDWYRDPQLIDYLEKLSADGFFRQFGKVFMTGTSMGGFAALAFASLAPGATIISFSPQTTLDESLVPWEERFLIGRRRDWSLPHSDCAFEIDDIEKAFVFYDPFFEPDRRHVERLEGDTVILLKTWFAGHFSPVFLRRANLLKPVMQHALDGTLTPAVFYTLFRERRLLPWYRKSLETNLAERGHAALARRVGPAFRKLKRQAAE